jgi:hypothetical protein
VGGRECADCVHRPHSHGQVSEARAAAEQALAQAAAGSHAALVAAREEGAALAARLAAAQQEVSDARARHAQEIDHVEVHACGQGNVE